MSVPIETTEVAPDAETVPDDAEVVVPDLSAEVEKWKALSRKNEDRATANAEKAQRFDAAEAASLTALEKAEARAIAAEGALVSASAATLRAEVASAKGVPAALLTGTTQEELEASADAMLAFKGKTPTAPSSDGAGNVGTPLNGGLIQITSHDELNSMTPGEVNKARRDGRLDSLMGIK
jgi:hypothetical protein